MRAVLTASYYPPPVALCSACYHSIVGHAEDSPLAKDSTIGLILSKLNAERAGIAPCPERAVQFCRNWSKAGRDALGLRSERQSVRLPLLIGECRRNVRILLVNPVLENVTRQSTLEKGLETCPRPVKMLSQTSKTLWSRVSQQYPTVF